MLQAVGPVAGAIVRNPQVQRIGGAVVAGVATYYAIRSARSIERGVGNLAKRFRRSRRNSQAQVTENGGSVTVTAVTTTTPSVPTVAQVNEALRGMGAVPIPNDEPGGVEAQHADGFEVKSFDELQAIATEREISFEGTPTKKDLAMALAKDYLANPGYYNGSPLSPDFAKNNADRLASVINQGEAK